MPRIYKGSETILKLLIDVPSTETIDKIKIALFTDNRSIAMEFFSDSITIYGNIAYLNAPEWTFMEMNDGIINYIAQGESNNKPFIFERQSNYILKSSDGFEMSDIMNGYYTKEETDVKLEAEQDKLESGKTIKTINGESLLGSGNIAVATELWVKNQDYATNSDVDEKLANVQVDLTGYATEQWVKRQGYVTDSDVNDYVGNEIGQVEEMFNDYYTKSQVDELISNIDIPEGGEDGVYFLEGGSYIHKYSYTETESGEINVLYDYNENYYESDRLTNNIELYQAILNGECKSVVYKTLNGYTTVLVSEDNGVKTYEQRAEYRCFPCQFEVVGNIVKEVAFSYVEKERVNFTTSPIYVKSMVLNSEGNFNSYATIDITDYYTKSEIDDKFANIDIPEGGEDGVYFLEPVEDIRHHKYIYNKESGTVETEYDYLEEYEGSARQQHNLEVAKACIEGKVKSLFIKMKYKEEYLFTEVENGYSYELYYQYKTIPLSFTFNELMDGELGTPDFSTSVLYKDTVFFFGYDGGSEYFVEKNAVTKLVLWLDKNTGSKKYFAIENILDIPEEKNEIEYITATMKSNGTYSLSGTYLYEALIGSTNDRAKKLYAIRLKDAITDSANPSYKVVYPTVYQTDSTKKYYFVVEAKYDDNNIIKWEYKGKTSVNSVLVPISSGGDSYTKEEIDSMIGDINNILKTI